jgi:PhnB protein
MYVQPYLHFDGCTEEALAFYRQAIGAEVTMLLRMNEAPEQPPPGTIPPGNEKKIMHAAFKVGDSTILASDGYCHGKAAFQGVTLTLHVPTEADADRRFNALLDGGKVTMPLGKTFFSPRFGMLTDRFGVAWIVIVPANQ